MFVELVWVVLSCYVDVLDCLLVVCDWLNECLGMCVVVCCFVCSYYGCLGLVDGLFVIGFVH